jgi:hypothetical protein
MSKVIRSLIFVLVFVTVADAAWARDEKSIKDLREALVALAPDVDPGEAEQLSVIAHTTSRRLAREYRVVGPPVFHNFLIRIGIRKRGLCFDWARDIGACLKGLKLKTLALHWGAAYAGTLLENNCVVVTARHQSFRDGIVIDGWRHGGRLCWRPVRKDWQNVWKEDMSETAWLQDYRPRERRPKRTTAQR